MVFREIDRSKIKGDKMTFIPVNKYLYVGNIEEEGEEDSDPFAAALLHTEY